jgi:hypothetical protein
MGIFTVLWVVIQRAERKRRRFTAIIMFFVGSVVWNYGVYVLSRQCPPDYATFEPICRAYVTFQKYNALAIQSVWVALIGSMVLSGVFWALIGRYNPVGSSDEIVVIGREGQPI